MFGFVCVEYDEIEEDLGDLTLGCRRWPDCIETYDLQFWIGKHLYLFSRK